MIDLPILISKDLSLVTAFIYLFFFSFEFHKSSGKDIYYNIWYIYIIYTADFHCRHRLLLEPKYIHIQFTGPNIRSFYETSRQNKKGVWYLLLAFFIIVLTLKSKFCFPSKWTPSSFALLIISIHCCEATIHLVCDYFWYLNNNRKGWHGWNKIGVGRGLEKFAKLIMWSPC